MPPILGRKTFLWIVILVWVTWDDTSFAQFRDSFEGGKPRWLLGKNDVAAKISVQQISPNMPHTGLACEQIELSVGQGNALQLVYPLPPFAIIEEFKASVWIRNPEKGTRLGVRIVFPRTAHPISGNQLTTVILGNDAADRGQWSLIQVQSPTQAMASQVTMLRAEYGPEIDLRDAYIDAIVLSPYRGPGVLLMQIDDLVIEGNVEVSPASLRASNRLAIEAESSKDPLIRMSERLHDLQRGAPRWLQYRGESLSWLKTLGITGVVLDRPMDARWLQEALEVGLQVLSPPPSVTPPSEEWEHYDAVYGWFIGSALDTSHMEPSRALSQRLIQFPAPLLRPTLLEAMEQYWGYSRIVDVLAVPAPLPTSVRDGKEMVQVLRESYDKTRGRSLPLTSLTIQPSPEIELQTKGLLQTIGNRGTSVPSLDILQARLRLYRCIAAGAHGWYFRSQTPLDSGDESDLLRAEVLRALNAEVDWLSPWIQAANPPIEIDSRSTPGYQASLLPMSNSQLIVMIATANHDSICAPTPDGTPIEFPMTSNTASSQAFRISHGRLEPVLNQTGPNRATIRIENPGLVELVVVTSDPRVSAYLQQRSRAAAQAILNLHSENANQLLRLSQVVLVSEQAPPNHPDWRWIREAEAQSRRMTYLMGRGDISNAIIAAESASHLSQRVIRASWLRALSRFPSPQSSPWIEHVPGLPHHWELSRILGERPWQPVDLPWGEPQQLQSFFDRGWSMDQRLEDLVTTQLAVDRPQRDEQTPVLSLIARSKQGERIPGGFGGSSLRFYSPSLRVPKGAMVRIDANIQVVSSAPSPQTGLLVYDSIGGPSSGILCSQNSVGDSSQPIRLFRFASGDEGVRIMMELRGEGEYRISNVRLSYLIPNLVSPYPTTPIEP